MEHVENVMLSMTDLEKVGWSKELLYRIAHMKDTPFFRSSPRGKFYVMESNLKEFVKTRRVGK